MQDVNAEHKDVLTLLKYNALEKPKTETKIKEVIVKETPNFFKNFVSVFGLTDAQKNHFINQGREVLNTFYDNIIENINGNYYTISNYNNKKTFYITPY